MADYRQSLRIVPDESFASKLRARRFEEGLSQAQLAERFGVRQQTIGAWERGERPQARFLAALAQYVGLADEQALRALLDADEHVHRPGSPGATGSSVDTTTARAVEALASLTESFAERLREGTPLSPEERSVLHEAVIALGRLTAQPPGPSDSR